MHRVPLFFSAKEAVPRRGEPVTVSLPWPRGAVTDEVHFALLNPAGEYQYLQREVLVRWPDGSVKWCLFDFLADWDGKSSGGYAIEISNRPSPSGSRIREPKRIGIETFGGLIRTKTTVTYPCANADRVTWTIHNPAVAGHPGGNWDLGGSGAQEVTDGRLFWWYQHSGPPRVRCSFERGMPFVEYEAGTIEQTTSGGSAITLVNHINRDRNIPVDGTGYVFDDYENPKKPLGQRATPIMINISPGGHFGVAFEEFWEHFPISVGSDKGDYLEIDFFPNSTYRELQGGERKTYRFVLSHRPDRITDEPLSWARSPITITTSPEWYETCGVLEYLTSTTSDRHPAYLALVDQAIDGPDTFLHKREAIDEYGWRHFGDIWGDHEAVGYKGPQPMISHYNNQYDCVAAFLIQYMRSGDVRWREQGIQCANHTCDIDIYHTTQDKSAYNGGLFWHTYHYAPADTGTHRSYPKSLRNQQHFDDGQDLSKMGETGAKLKKNYAVGGGPSAAHNYNYGLELAYYLTGNPDYKENAIGLADFVLNMDDGRKTIFKWLTTRDTGLSIQSSDGYLGPGRASGNSLNAVLVGHRLTGDKKYLDKAEQIVRRVVHPEQNLESLDLLNAELRWFYVMFLQALGNYLDYKIDLDQLDENYAYARASLLHYARWMAEHERPILFEPEKLQYPNETWAAQDLRKVEVFQFAAKHATGEEKKIYLDKAAWFFEYCVSTLHTFETKSLTRPVILCMKYGWSRNWWLKHPETSAPEPRMKLGPLKPWRMYVPQKVVAIKRAKIAIAFGGLLAFMMMIAVLWWLFS